MKVTRRSVLLGAGAALFAAPLGGGAIVACERTAAPLVDRQRVLADTANLVIVPAYEEASIAAAALSSAMDSLAAQGNAGALSSAQEAWRGAHRAWKRTEATSFGPADDLATTAGAIDGGPPDEAKLSALLSGSTAIDDRLVASLGGNQRGFAGIEWLLFDPSSGNAAIVAALGGTTGLRRRSLGSVIARDLRAKIDAVRDAWLPGKGGYATALADAGRGSAVYASERQGIDAIVNALLAASEILTSIRLAKPLGLDQSPQASHPELVESRRAGAAIEDLLAVLDGIEAVYTCTLRGSGLSMSAAVRDYAPAGDDRFRQDLERARQATRAIPSPLDTAVTASRDVVLAAYTAVREVKRRLSTEIASALGTSVGFNVTDGD